MSFRLPSPEDLRQLRRTLDLTQKELAYRAGVSQALIAGIEAGKIDPRLSTLRRILNAMMRPQEGKVASDIMHSPIVCLKTTDNVRKAVSLMEKYAISQLPVLKEDVVVGSIQETTLVRKILQSPRPEEIFSQKIESLMEDPFPIVSPSATMGEIFSLLSQGVPAVLVMDRGKIVGIITKIDVITAIRPK